MVGGAWSVAPAPHGSSAARMQPPGSQDVRGATAESSPPCFPEATKPDLLTIADFIAKEPHASVATTEKWDEPVSWIGETIAMKKSSKHLIAEVPRSVTKIGMTIGIDLEDVWSHYCTLNEDGEVVDRGRFRTTLSGVEKWFTDVPRARVAMEAGTHSIWVSEQLREPGHEVIVSLLTGDFWPLAFLNNLIWTTQRSVILSEVSRDETARGAAEEPALNLPKGTCHWLVPATCLAPVTHIPFARRTA